MVNYFPSKKKETMLKKVSTSFQAKQNVPKKKSSDNDEATLRNAAKNCKKNVKIQFSSMVIPCPVRFDSDKKRIKSYFREKLAKGRTTL